jgi:hypothetical protein
MDVGLPIGREAQQPQYTAKEAAAAAGGQGGEVLKKRGPRLLVQDCVVCVCVCVEMCANVCAHVCDVKGVSGNTCVHERVTCYITTA